MEVHVLRLATYVTEGVVDLPTTIPNGGSQQRHSSAVAWPSATPTHGGSLQPTGGLSGGRSAVARASVRMLW
jgi:hypothetical protein